MSRLNWFATILGTTVFGLMMISVSHAWTPDGETPAQESVCDPLKADGVTPALYGLCVAFCEAQDWERCADAPDTCGRPHATLLKNYEKLRKEGDPAMPCIVSASQCPCWDGSAAAFPGRVTLASIWTSYVNFQCEIDQCLDTNFVSVVSGATCASSNGFLATTVAKFDPILQFCQAIGVKDGIQITVDIALDDATFNLCLAEHDNFTAGGTFPNYNTFACGLPTP